MSNPDEFRSVWDLFALRNGGLVAYGGFIGGLVGSWAYLAPKKILLLAWADDAGPSLGSGLLVTRILFYLFGLDFGNRLPDPAPQRGYHPTPFPPLPPIPMPIDELPPPYP